MIGRRLSLVVAVAAAVEFAHVAARLSIFGEWIGYHLADQLLFWINNDVPSEFDDGQERKGPG